MKQKDSGVAREKENWGTRGTVLPRDILLIFNGKGKQSISK